jgi:hypothetical protein
MGHLYSCVILTWWQSSLPNPRNRKILERGMGWGLSCISTIHNHLLLPFLHKDILYPRHLTNSGSGRDNMNKTRNCFHTVQDQGIMWGCRYNETLYTVAETCAGHGRAPDKPLAGHFCYRVEGAPRKCMSMLQEATKCYGEKTPRGDLLQCLGWDSLCLSEP